ncbi:MAG: VOC family protein [Planctomycetota bacterium]
MNDFIWVDLSTFDPAKAHRFYGRVLGWSFDTDASGYSNASTAGVAQPTAGLYPMPEFFRKIKMPSFWMSYIQVADIDAVVAKAGGLGARIELQEDNALGRIALVRDPLGAGFTCIQNDALNSGQGNAPGQYAGSELVISDPGRANDFYSSLFNWSFKDQGHDQYTIHQHDGEVIASMQAASNDVKGDKEYWAVYFVVKDLGQARQAIEAADGAVIYAYDAFSGEVLIGVDDQGAAFYLSAG